MSKTDRQIIGTASAGRCTVCVCLCALGTYSMRNRCLLATCSLEVGGIRHAVYKSRACGVLLHVIQLLVLLPSENMCTIIFINFVVIYSS